jgi:hypothetical protein
MLIFGRRRQALKTFLAFNFWQRRPGEKALLKRQGLQLHANASAGRQ